MEACARFDLQYPVIMADMHLSTTQILILVFGTRFVAYRQVLYHSLCATCKCIPL